MISYIKFIVKCEKNVKRKQLNTQFYTVSTFVIPFYYGSRTVINSGSGSAHVIKLRFPFRYSKKLQFLRFRFRFQFRNTDQINSK